MQPLATSVQRAYTADLAPDDLYRIVRLRVDVFVVEQHCPYQDLDGRDLESTTRHFWVDSPDGNVLGYLRLLETTDGTFSIGRVCTAKSARGLGLARKLMRAALAEIQDAPVMLSAQTYVTDFYRSFGFSELGEQYLEYGIPHIDMCRQPGAKRGSE